MAPRLPILLLTGLLLAATATSAQKARPAPASPTKNAESAIKEADLKRDLFALAGDKYRGRDGGTLVELRASSWLAEQMRAIGMQPAGDDGTYFQWFNLRRTRLMPASTLRIGGHMLRPGHEAVVVAPVNAQLKAKLVFVGTGTPAEVAKAKIKGKAVAVQLSGEPTDGISYRRYLFGKLREQAAELGRAGAVAVVFVSDDKAQAIYEHWSHIFERGRYGLPADESLKIVGDQLPVVWLPMSEAEALSKSGQELVADLRAETFLYPSVNIVARQPGTDAQLKSQHVLFSTHQDHDGVRAPVAGDSIYNGADDNATGCAALLAVMRAFKQQPAKRSALFVYHGAEERGLLGSRYFSNKPTVPRESIVAVLNAEMMGRNAPDSAALLGSVAPHLNSSDLVKTALTANQAGPRFKLDTEWDKATHPEGWYFRSDHLPYARLGIPAVMFTSLLHADYHTPNDEPATIDYGKLRRMTQWLYLTGWAVANRPAPPAREPGFRLER